MKHQVSETVALYVVMATMTVVCSANHKDKQKRGGPQHDTGRLKVEYPKRFRTT
jgi:hypothetical protein